AGIQADIKTVTALGGYAATAVTAITVQDTQKVHAVHPVPTDVIIDQIRVVRKDIGADAIKIGMIGTRSAGEAILEALERWPAIPLVLDPVLVATSGDALGDDGVASLIRDEFLPRATVLTPNVPEAEALSGRGIETSAQFEVAARDLCDLGAGGVMAKAGHLSGDPVTDFYYQQGWVFPYRHPRLDTRHTHGTGCTLASAIATGLAQGLSASKACERAVAYVAAAIEYAPGFGQGHGPLNHALRQEGDQFLPI
ncbi:MAG: bifunctional hydroxymethylpyrimidine kinase/phosphomethylpyrimidine kinase, partial [Pseudomonadota bacterium]